MSDTYTIEYHKLGMVVVGSIPASDFVHLAKLAGSRGYDLMFPGIGDALGGNHFVFSSKSDGGQWLENLAANARKNNREWLLSGDTGISSTVIYCVMTGKNNARNVHGADTPRDPSDFGRCHRLLADWYPEWRSRLPEVAERYPHWGPMVREWQKMTDLYLRDLPTGWCEELYSLMKKLMAEAEALVQS